MNCMERADLYLLDAAGGLSSAESAELRAHLATGCCVCAGNAAEAAAVVAQLAQLSPSQIPSPQLLERLMSKVDLSSPTEIRTPSTVMRIAPSSIAVAEQRLRNSLPPKQGDRTIGFWRTAGISAAAACVAVAATTVFLHSQLGRSAGQFAAEPAILETRDLRYVSMAGSSSGSHASGRIFWDADHHVWHVYVFDLAPPPQRQTYQLWMISKSGVIRGAGTFDVDATGTGKLLVNVPPDTGPLAAAAITNEPLGGSAQPTGTKLLIGTIN